MTGKTHIIAGLLAGAVYVDETVGLTFPSAEEIGVTTPVMLTIGLASVAGATLPDIDISNSFASRAFFPLRLVYKILERLFGEEVFGHRRFTHTAIFPLLLLCLNFFHFTDSPADKYIHIAILAMIYGIVSHFILDMLNPMGIPLFAPFKKTNVRIIPRSCGIYTGSTKESVFAVLLFIAAAAYIICSFAGVI